MPFPSPALASLTCLWCGIFLLKPLSLHMAERRKNTTNITHMTGIVHAVSCSRVCAALGRGSRQGHLLKSLSGFSTVVMVAAWQPEGSYPEVRTDELLASRSLCRKLSHVLMLKAFSSLRQAFSRAVTRIRIIYKRSELPFSTNAANHNLPALSYDLLSITRTSPLWM